MSKRAGLFSETQKSSFSIKTFFCFFFFEKLTNLNQKVFYQTQKNKRKKSEGLTRDGRPLGATLQPV